MIYDIFLPFLIIFSIFAIIIILVKKIPEISFENETEEKTTQETKTKHSFLTSLFFIALSVLEKNLRQIRIYILKLDTKIFSCIEYLRSESSKKLKEVNNFSYKNITKAAVEDQANKISAKLQFKIAETKLLHIIAKFPKKAENYKKLGELYIKNENFFDAVASLEEYLKLNPEDKEIEKILIEIKAKTLKKTF